MGAETVAVLDLLRIVRATALKDGRLIVVGAGVTVKCLATWYQLDMAPEQIVRKIGHLPLA